jgi:hypothetical protein
MVVPWNEGSNGEAPFLNPRTFDLDPQTVASAPRGGECVIIFRHEGASGAASSGSSATNTVIMTPDSSAASSPSAAERVGAIQPFLQPLYLLIASLMRKRYTIVGLEDLPRRLMRTCRDPAKEPCPAKRVASLHHFVVAAVCACWNVAAGPEREDERTVEQLAGRIRLLTKAQYRAEVGAKQYALESFDTPVEGPAEDELALPDEWECECGKAQCGRGEETPGVQLDGDWGEIVRQVLLASATAKQ